MVPRDIVELGFCGLSRSFTRFLVVLRCLVLSRVVSCGFVWVIKFDICLDSWFLVTFERRYSVQITFEVFQHTIVKKSFIMNK